MIKNIKNIFVITILTSISVFYSSCEKLNPVDEDNEPLELTIDKTNVTPFEAITITSSNYTFLNDMYPGIIADRDIEMRKTADNKLMFMMPSISSGSQTLSFNLAGHDFNIEFTIDALPVVDNPEVIITDFKQEMSNMVDTIEYLNSISGLNVSEQNLQLIKTYLAEFNQANTTATDAEKQELAQFMQVNPELFDLGYFNFQILNDSLVVGSRSFVAWDKKLTRDMQYFTGLIIATGATIGIFNGTLYSGNPFLIGAATLALATEFVLVFDQTETMLNRSYKPFEIDFLNGQKSATNIEFENNIPFILGIDASYRTLYNNDEGSSSVIIDLVANINTFTGYWNTAVSYIPGLDGTVTNLDDQNAYKVNSSTAPVTPQYITIENISNSNVTISQFSNTDAVRVTFTTSANEDQDFAFDIVYTNPDFSEERITVDAVISVVEPFYLTGNWHFTWYTDDTRTEATQIDLINFQNGPPSVGEPISSYYVSSGETVSTVGSPATWNQSYNPDQWGYELPVVSLTNNYWGNILLRFVYDEENPNTLIGESIGLSNNGFNLELTKQ